MVNMLFKILGTFFTLMALAAGVVMVLGGGFCAIHLPQAVHDASILGPGIIGVIFLAIGYAICRGCLNLISKIWHKNSTNTPTIPKSGNYT